MENKTVKTLDMEFLIKEIQKLEVISKVKLTFFIIF